MNQLIIKVKYNIAWPPASITKWYGRCFMWAAPFCSRLPMQKSSLVYQFDKLYFLFGYELHLFPKRCMTSWRKSAKKARSMSHWWGNTAHLGWLADLESWLRFCSGRCIEWSIWCTPLLASGSLMKGVQWNTKLSSWEGSKEVSHPGGSMSTCNEHLMCTQSLGKNSYL